MIPSPLRLVIFDCDGVLIDSEGPASRVISRTLQEVGWTLTPEAARARFEGKRLSDVRDAVEATTGRVLPPNWVEALQAALVAELTAGVALIEGAEAALRAARDLGLPFRIASNSSHAELAAKFAVTGIADLVAGRVHSAGDVGVGKPDPALFLATAAAEGVPPETCLVIEDSRPGVMAARAAGMPCLGYTPHGDGAALRALGALPLCSLTELPDLFRLHATKGFPKG
ncbi:MAG TPA: HAD family phosphatase [Acetobacteraceae bacterium]|nr:HAD family phosphatase [Acetobacteraceae bacterium]